MFLEAVLYALSGFFMKFSDDALDVENNTILGILGGIICVIGMGYLSVNFTDAATIFLAILLGTLLSGKVDKIGQLVTLGIFLAILAIFGMPYVGLGSLVVCTIAAWLDEVGNDRESLNGIKIVEKFFNYRCALKIAVLVLAVVNAPQASAGTLLRLATSAHPNRRAARWLHIDRMRPPTLAFRARPIPAAGVPPTA